MKSYTNVIERYQYNTWEKLTAELLVVDNFDTVHYCTPKAPIIGPPCGSSKN